jgi:hypothetical protein
VDDIPIRNWHLLVERKRREERYSIGKVWPKR